MTRNKFYFFCISYNYTKTFKINNNDITLFSIISIITSIMECNMLHHIKPLIYKLYSKICMWVYHGTHSVLQHTITTMLAGSYYILITPLMYISYIEQWFN